MYLCVWDGGEERETGEKEEEEELNSPPTLKRGGEKMGIEA